MSARSSRILSFDRRPLCLFACAWRRVAHLSGESLAIFFDVVHVFESALWFSLKPAVRVLPHDWCPMYESRNSPLIPLAQFARRLATHLGAASALLVVSLAVGMLGYVELENLSSVDAFLNSAMLLGGMGPVNPPQTTAGKIFAGIYALYAGLVFIVTAALVFTPILHRLMHHFHWSEKV